MAEQDDGPTVLVYATDEAVIAQVRTALGRRPVPEAGRLRYVEARDGAEVLAALDTGDLDVAVLDGEAWPSGGMGLARQMKFEYDDAPACLVLTARRDDRWLASWSLADAVLQHPVEPVRLRELVAALVRRRAGVLPGAGEAGRERLGSGTDTPGSDGLVPVDV